MYEQLILDLCAIEDLSQIISNMMNYDLMIRTKKLPLDQVDPTMMNKKRWILLYRTYKQDIPTDFLNKHIISLNYRSILITVIQNCIINDEVFDKLPHGPQTVIVKYFTTNVHVTSSKLLNIWMENIYQQPNLLELLPLSESDVYTLVCKRLPPYIIYRLLDNPSIPSDLKNRLHILRSQSTNSQIL
jgi:hypothetical protein